MKPFSFQQSMFPGHTLVIQTATGHMENNMQNHMENNMAAFPGSTDLPTTPSMTSVDQGTPRKWLGPYKSMKPHSSTWTKPSSDMAMYTYQSTPKGVAKHPFYLQYTSTIANSTYIKSKVPLGVTFAAKIHHNSQTSHTKQPRTNERTNNRIIFIKSLKTRKGPPFHRKHAKQRREKVTLSPRKTNVISMNSFSTIRQLPNTSHSFPPLHVNPPLMPNDQSNNETPSHNISQTATFPLASKQETEADIFITYYDADLYSSTADFFQTLGFLYRLFTMVAATYFHSLVEAFSTFVRIL